MNTSLIEEWLQQSPLLRGLEPEVLAEIRSFAEGQVARIQELVKIGLALSAEKDLDQIARPGASPAPTAAPCSS